MLNEEKIRIMTGIAMFEKKAGRDILPASRYFKSDYVGGRMIRSFIFYTFSSMLCLALWVLYQMEDIMSTMDVTALLASAKHVALFYAAGLLILALGIILNTKSGLGVSPIISVAYSIATIGGFNFGNITFLLYSAFVVVEIVLHIFRNQRYSREADGAIAPAAHRDLKLVLLMDLLQLPLSLVFTRFMNLFSALLPAPSDNMLSRLLILAAGIILTGIGAAMSLNMRIIPNPGDGIVQAISDCVGKSVGFTKNCFDLFNICLTTFIGLIFAHKLIGIGLGTVIAVLGVGRVIAVFNHHFFFLLHRPLRQTHRTDLHKQYHRYADRKFGLACFVVKKSHT